MTAFDDPTFENERKSRMQKRIGMVLPSHICYAWLVAQCHIRRSLVGRAFSISIGRSTELETSSFIELILADRQYLSQLHLLYSGKLRILPFFTEASVPSAGGLK
jgi:hypothetical protein